MSAAEQRILSVKDALAQARSLFRIAAPASSPTGRGDPAPPPMMAAPGPAASAARLRGEAVERELASLAAELGTGRDAALLRALGFYRRFVRKARREGRAPEEFLRELTEVRGRGDVRGELAEIRARLDELSRASRPGIGVTTTAPPPVVEPSVTFAVTAPREWEAPRAPSRLQSSRKTKIRGDGPPGPSREGARGGPEARPTGPREVPASAVLREARGRKVEKRAARPMPETPFVHEIPETPPPPPAPKVVPGSTAALAARMAGFGPLAEPEAPPPPPPVAAAPGAPPPPPEPVKVEAPSGPSYAERRAKLPKITF